MGGWLYEFLSSDYRKYDGRARAWMSRAGWNEVRDGMGAVE